MAVSLGICDVAAISLVGVVKPVFPFCGVSEIKGSQESPLLSESVKCAFCKFC